MVVHRLYFPGGDQERLPSSANVPAFVCGADGASVARLARTCHPPPRAFSPSLVGLHLPLQGVPGVLPQDKEADFRVLRGEVLRGFRDVYIWEI